MKLRAIHEIKGAAHRCCHGLEMGREAVSGVDKSGGDHLAIALLREEAAAAASRRDLVVRRPRFCVWLISRHDHGQRGRVGSSRTVLSVVMTRAQCRIGVGGGGSGLWRSGKQLERVVRRRL